METTRNKAQNLLNTTLQCILYNSYTCYLFTLSNLLEIVAMPLFFAIITAVASPVLEIPLQKSPTEMIRRVPAMIFWSWSNLLLFNIHNQRHANSVVEDSINKPWRPLPSNRITPQQSKRLLLALYPVVLLYCGVFGGLISFFLEAFWCLWYNEWDGAQTPFLKNFLNATGFAAFLSGPLEVVLGLEINLFSCKYAVIWIYILGAAIFTTSQLQDFRDQDGDRLQGRRTLPLVIGDTRARLLTLVAIIFWSYTGPLFWQLSAKAYLVTTIPGMVMICNLMFQRTVKGDKLTWRMWPFWMSSFFVLPLMKTYA